MTTRYREQMLGRYATEASRVTAALRLLLLVPLGLSILAPQRHSHERAFALVLAVYPVWAAGWVVLVFRTASRTCSRRRRPASTGVDRRRPASTGVDRRRPG